MPHFESSVGSVYEAQDRLEKCREFIHTTSRVWNGSGIAPNLILLDAEASNPVKEIKIGKHLDLCNKNMLTVCLESSLNVHAISLDLKSQHT